jgi:hypothetical protein
MLLQFTYNKARESRPILWVLHVALGASLAKTSTLLTVGFLPFLNFLLTARLASDVLGKSSFQASPRGCARQ